MFSLFLIQYADNVLLSIHSFLLRLSSFYLFIHSLNNTIPTAFVTGKKKKIVGWILFIDTDRMKKSELRINKQRTIVAVLDMESLGFCHEAESLGLCLRTDRSCVCSGVCWERGERQARPCQGEL